jgi:riboflavin synthase
MFTGLVEGVGEVVDVSPVTGGYRLRVRDDLAGHVQAGESLAMNGVCLTLTEVSNGEMHADIGPETARVTSLGTLVAGSLVNLERPLRADGRLGGHFVQGHVDGTGTIEDVRHEAEFAWVTVSFPPHLAPYLIPKGSIAVDGISFTIATLHDDRFDLMVIPYTLEHTNLKTAGRGDRVNLECDMIGKYVVRLAELAGLGVGGTAEGSRQAVD